MESSDGIEWPAQHACSSSRQGKHKTIKASSCEKNSYSLTTREGELFLQTLIIRIQRLLLALLERVEIISNG